MKDILPKPRGLLPNMPFEKRLRIAKRIIRGQPIDKGISLRQKYDALLAMLELFSDGGKIIAMETLLFEKGLLPELKRRCSKHNWFFVSRKLLEEEKIKTSTYLALLKNTLAEQEILKKRLQQLEGIKQAPQDDML